MKQHKRLWSLLLALCMIISAIPAVFATDSSEAETADAVYDFMQYDAGTSRISVASKIEELNTRYADASDPLNWNFVAACAALTDTATNLPKDPNISFTTLHSFRLMTNVGHWVAFKIQSPGAGEFDITIDRTLYASGGRGGMYILPAETADIEAALTEAALVGTADFYDADAATPSLGHKAVVGSWEFEAGKEYMLVFRCEAALRPSSTNGYIYFSSIEMKAKEKLTYDFYQQRFTVGGNGLNAKVDTIAAEYAAGTLNWKYETAPDTLTTSESQFRPQEESLRVNTAVNEWIAFRIKAPGQGDYTMTLHHGAGYHGASQGSVYVLPASTTDIPTALAATAPVTTFNNCAAASETGKSSASGSYYFAAGQEYLVVFKSDVKSNNSNYGYLYLTQLEMAESEVKSYAFFQPAYNGNKLTGRIDEIASRYADPADPLNWKFETIEGTGLLTDETLFRSQEMSLRVNSSVNEWIAFRFQSPGEGNYEVSMINGAGYHGAALGNVYILPGDTADVAAALKKTGKLFTANWCAAASEIDRASNSGVYTFEDDKEYIVVFRAETKSDNSNAAYMYLGQMTMTATNKPATELVDPNLIEPVFLGTPVATFTMTSYAAFDVVNGENYYYAPAKGGKLYVYNLDTGKKVDEELTGFGDPRCCIVDENGILYVAGASTQILRYDPFTGIATQLPAIPASAGNILSLALDENGDLYLGTDKEARIYKYDVSEGTYTDYGRPEADGTHLISMAYHDGFLYVQSYGNYDGDDKMTKTLAKINGSTKDVVATLNLAEKLPETTSGFYHLSIIGGDTLIGGGDKLPNMIAVDLATFSYMEDIGIASGNVGRMSEVVDGKSYFVAYQTGLCEYDVTTRKATVVEGFEAAAIGLRSIVTNVLYLNNPALPGANIATNSASNGAPVFYNLQTKTTFKWDEPVSGDGTGQSLRALTNGTAGSGDIYIGTYGIANAVVYNTKTGEYSLRYKTSGQTDSQIYYNGKIYAGCYPGAMLTEVDPVSNTQKILFNLKNEGYEQTRIHTLTAGDGKVFAGTTPDTGKRGGAIAWYDIDSGEIYVERNVVKDQTIQCLVYYGGYLYGTTSKQGGSNAASADCAEKEAVIFVYDVANKRKIAQYSLESIGYENADYIAGISADPNNPGKFWGIVAEGLFSFTVNAETHEIENLKDEVSFSKTEYVAGAARHWFPRGVLFGPDGYLYVGFVNAGGFRKINPDKPVEDNVRLMEDMPLYYLLGEDNNLYYSYAEEFKMLPLNLQTDDAVVAERVVNLIDAIDSTSDKAKWAVMPAREAYDALTDAQKDLVTNYAELTAAEAAVADALAAYAVAEKIAAIGTVTLDSEEAITAARSAYNALTDAQKDLVTNTDDLTAAEASLAELKAAAEKEAADKAAADAVIAKIDAIGTVTLESEEAIKEARTAYDALTAEQKALVDAAKLTTAEAKLAELKAAAEKEAADKAAANAVAAKIEAIGTVTLESEEAITAARAAYDALTAEQKALVDAAKLTAAEAKLAELKATAENEAADKAAADTVIAKINAIGKVTAESGDAIAAARRAYNALTDDQKALVSNLDVLTDAEAAYEDAIKDPGSPDTGDNAPVMLLAAILLISTMAMAVLVPTRRNRA